MKINIFKTLISLQLIKSKDNLISDIEYISLLHVMFVNFRILIDQDTIQKRVIFSFSTSLTTTQWKLKQKSNPFIKK